MLGMSTLTIQVPAGLRSKLAAMAKRLGQTPEQFVRETLVIRLEAAPTSPGPSLYERSRDLCGSLDGGPPDLGRNQKHLKGYGSWKR
jgi:hypothetical protein